MIKLHPNAKNLAGQTFGQLIAIEPTEKRSGGHIQWRCICDCGKECFPASSTLIRGDTVSCGCFGKTKNITHGLRYHPLYKLYAGIKNRCYNKNEPAYYRYGGRGIRVCKEWLGSPKIFIEWALANGYKKWLSIERKNNDGDYSSENCYFATPLEQANNTKHLKLFIAYGPCGQIEVAKNQSAFARKWGLQQAGISMCVRCIIKQYKGWTFEHLEKKYE